VRRIRARRVTAALRKESDVVSANVSTVTQGIALINVVPRTGPNDPATSDLVTHIRDHRAAIEGTTGTHLLVGGATATDIDVSSQLGQALPIFLVVVVGLAFILLTFAFRTILVPIKSIIGFLLSVGAAFGAQVAVFQWGGLAGPLGIAKSETLSFLPIILLAIIFGLSSDYEVFVVSRIKEHFTNTATPDRP
jgi:RND superfamily putative drug exporter